MTNPYEFWFNACADAMRSAGEFGQNSLLSFAPYNLSQIINPWNFGGQYTVTNENSSAPHVERAVTADKSYGKQIGIMLDALRVIAAYQPKECQAHDAIKKLEDLAKRIDEVKAEESRARTEAFLKELERLKSQNSKLYDELAEKLRSRI